MNWLKENFSTLLILSVVTGGGAWYMSSGSSNSVSEEDDYQSEDGGTDYGILSNRFDRNDNSNEERSYEEYGDYDCSDFSTHEEAQEFFESQEIANDYHNLNQSTQD